MGHLAHTQTLPTFFLRVLRLKEILHSVFLQVEIYMVKKYIIELIVIFYVNG